MRYTRLYTGPDNRSHFEDVDVPLEDAGTIGRLSEAMTTTGIIFRENDPTYDYDWHNAPRPQFVVMLEGSVEIEIGDGTRRTFGPGDILLCEDTTGQGHRSRVPDNKPRRSLFITLD